MFDIHALSYLACVYRALDKGWSQCRGAEGRTDGEQFVSIYHRQAGGKSSNCAAGDRDVALVELRAFCFSII